MRLKIFSYLSRGMMTAKELSSRCGAIPVLLKLLLDACVSIGLLLSRDGKYENSDFSRTYLVEGGELYVGDLIRLQYNELQQWYKLYSIVKTGGDRGGKEESKEEEYTTFIKAMNNLGMLGEAHALRDAVDLSGCREMVDAGGGSGLYSIFLCRKYPNLRATILDRKETLCVTEKMIAGSAERKRITLREADISKDSFGRGVDAVLLSDVVYDSVMATAVLTNAWKCLRGGGILIVRGYYADPEGTGSLFGALFALNELIFDPERKILTISSLKKEVHDAGFTRIHSSPLTKCSFLITSRKQQHSSRAHIR